LALPNVSGAFHAGVPACPPADCCDRIVSAALARRIDALIDACSERLDGGGADESGASTR
jgi:hypothetical protein